MPNNAAVVTRADTGRVGSVAPSSAEASTDRAVSGRRRFDQITDGARGGPARDLVATVAVWRIGLMSHNH